MLELAEIVKVYGDASRARYGDRSYRVIAIMAFMRASQEVVLPFLLSA